MDNKEFGEVKYLKITVKAVLHSLGNKEQIKSGDHMLPLQ
jgi:hypothetical protein